MLYYIATSRQADLEGYKLFWAMLFLILMLLCGAGAFYLAGRIKKLKAIEKLSQKSKKLGWAVSIGTVILLCVILGLIFGMFTAVVLVLHIILVWAVTDLIAFIVKKLSKKELCAEIRAAATAVLLIIYFSYGWYNAHNVIGTDYSVSTDKLTDDIKIAMIADSHMGVTLDGDAFAKALSEIQEQKPDLLFIVGDLVDDGSDKEDMISACEALGEFEATYGVYYVYGNHDKGYSDSIAFTDEELRNELSANGVIILEDEVINIENELCIIGRKDRSDEDRQDISKLLAGIDSSMYTIVLDHQPNDYDAIEEAGADLVLSGHTHGGHIFPAGYVGLLIGANDKVYGYERRSDTDFIVTSGISGWAIPFKTGCVSEYVIIEIDAE